MQNSKLLARLTESKTFKSTNSSRSFQRFIEINAPELYTRYRTELNELMNAMSKSNDGADSVKNGYQFLRKLGYFWGNE